jgi:hypothetical protein
MPGLLPEIEYGLVGNSKGGAAQTTAVPGKPVAHITAVGGAGVSGAIIANSVQCSEPRPEGRVIFIFGALAGQTAETGVFLQITIQPHTVSVKAASGSAAAYSERDFTGSGVSGFDAAKGAQVSATMTETIDASLKPGTIGAMTSLTMSVDCANQQPGSATITLVGSTASGQLNASLTSAHVTCSTGTQGERIVVVHALAQLGSGPSFVILAMRLQSATISGLEGFYRAPDNAASTSATGGHVSGDFTEQSVPAASAHVVHASGDAVCGSSITP